MTDILTQTLRLTEPTPGGDSGTWPTLLNSDMAYIDEAINQSVTVSIADVNVVLIADGTVSDQARYLRYNFTGALTANRTVTLPSNVKVGWATNNTTGGHNVILSTGAGTTLSLLPEASWTLFNCDGTNVVAQTVRLGALNLTGACVLSNNQPIGGKDNLGVAQQILLMDVNNNVTIQNGGGQLVRVVNQAASTNLMTIDDGGVVTLGAGPLVVTGSRNGSISGAGQFNSAGVFTGISGTVGFSGNFSQAVLSGVAFYAGSDERAKDDLSAISAGDAEAWVMAGKPLTFLVDGVKHAGFSAQDETKTVRRESITAAASDDPRFSVSDGIAPDGHRLLKDYQHDIAYLTRFVQVLVERIEALEARP